MALPPIPPSPPGLPKVTGATTGNIPTFTQSGGAVNDSTKYFSDTVTTNQNIWSSNQTASYVTTQLLNTPTLPQVNAATTANNTLTGTQTIDGVAVVAGNFVLVKNQTTSGQNGIYKVAAGAWVRQVYNSGTQAYQDISTETTYAQLNINGGVVNVIAGTVAKNLQYQFYIPIPAGLIASNGSSVFVTAVTKLPVAGATNRFVDVTVGNDTNNNGSSSFPYATITKALVGMNFPGTITVAASPAAEPSNVTFSASNPNCIIQSQNTANSAGQTLLSGQMTFASGSTRVHFNGTSHSNAAPFLFNNNSQGRSYFQNITIVGATGDWLGLHSGVLNWITLDNVIIGSPAAYINLPNFSQQFTIYVTNQIIGSSTGGYMVFAGTGAPNTNIVIANSAETAVRIPSTYVGNIVWENPEFTSSVGSSAMPVGVLSSQADLTTITAWTTDTTYDGYYLINFASPTTFAQGAIIHKITAGGFTNLCWIRTFSYAPATMSDLSGNLYKKGTAASLSYSAVTSGGTPVTTLTLDYTSIPGFGSSYNVQLTDAVVYVDQSPYTVNLPDPATCPGQVFYIKNNASFPTGSITINVAGGGGIEGGFSYTLPTFQTGQFQSDGALFWKIN